MTKVTALLGKCMDKFADGSAASEVQFPVAQARDMRTLAC